MSGGCVNIREQTTGQIAVGRGANALPASGTALRVGVLFSGGDVDVERFCSSSRLSIYS
jgi:hypothetical protein